MTRQFTTALFLVLIVALAGCQSQETRTFAGFTYGGGGHTFSAEPAVMTVSTELTVLECGKVGDSDYVKLSWKGTENTGEELPLSTGTFSVKGKPSSDLQTGQIVVQSEKGKIVHGSFELETKTEDGRVLKVVGSFSAEKL
jgi:hypothetical protein